MKTRAHIPMLLLVALCVGCAEKQAAVRELELEMAARQGFPSSDVSTQTEVVADKPSNPTETESVPAKEEDLVASEDAGYTESDSEDLTEQLEQEAERLLAEGGDETTLVTDIAASEISAPGEETVQGPAVGSEPDPNRVPEQEEAPPAEMIRGGSGAYTVQIASTPSSGYARQLVDKYTLEGYLPYISEVNVNGRVVYRVRIGHLSSQLEADRLQSDLATRYGIEGWIDRIK